MPDSEELLLAGYRGLDFTDQRGLLCGKVLADLGAEVIKVERPRGDKARDLGPFCDDIPHSEKSLYWFAYNANKKGITLNVECADGRALLHRLLKDCDFLIESFDPGYLDGLGLDYGSLKTAYPGLVFTSITSFGSTGPCSRHASSDLTNMAAGGYMYMTGDLERPPLNLPCDQSYLHAGAEAAVAIMIALYERGASGRGQHVDVSAQASLLTSTVNAIPFWLLGGTVLGRSGAYRSGLTAARQRQLWQSKDGYVIFYFAGGAFGSKANPALMAWLESEGLADDFVRSIDWSSFDMALASEEVEGHLEGLVGRLFSQYTTEELYAGAIERGLTLCPVYAPEGILQDPQLAARDYWAEIEHEKLGGSFKYPGPLVRTTGMRTSWRRAPAIGEHNMEIYRDGLGLTEDQLAILKEAGAI